MPLKIGVDIGGTKIMAGLIDGHNHIIQKTTVMNKPLASKQAVLEHISDIIRPFVSHQVSLIGVGVPAIVDAEEGVVYQVVSIPSWDEVPLKAILEDEFHIPVLVNNDCNCFAQGVALSPDFRKYENVVCITLGTGVGAGLIMDRKLYTGKDSLAGEIGSMAYLDKDYEYYCSSRFFLARGTTGKEAAQKAALGCPDALQLWREMGHHLGQLLHTVLYAYNPQAIVFGGSISKAFEYFEAAMRQQLATFPYANVVKRLVLATVNTENTMLLGSTHRM